MHSMRCPWHIIRKVCDGNSLKTEAIQEKEIALLLLSIKGNCHDDTIILSFALRCGKEPDFRQVMVLLVPEFVCSRITQVLLDDSSPAIVNHGGAIDIAVFSTTILLIDDGVVKHVNKHRVDLVDEDSL